MSKQQREDTPGCQGGEDCASGKRNRYFRHKKLGAAEWRTEQEYFLRRRRIINRSMHGWGVVAGFSMPHEAPASVGSGLAFDRHGRELLLCEPVTVDERNCYIADPAKPGETLPLRQAAPGAYLLRAHYAERGIGDAALDPECGCDAPEKNFICETVVFSLQLLANPECCHCEEGGCERHCGCGGKCCDSGRGPHSCLCAWVSAQTVSCLARLPCRWKGMQFDPCDAVPLACVTLVESKDPCNPIAIGAVQDACSPRRLVKNNDLLYDLVRGCDLTRIDRISWAVFHRADPMSLEEFKYFLGTGPIVSDGLKYAPSRFTVRFSGPVLADTVTTDCFAFRITLRHVDTGWYEQRVVPVIHVDKAGKEAGDPADTIREVTLGLHPKLYAEVTGEASAFDPQFNHEAVAEIEVYGDYILDCSRQAIDGNAHGFELRRPRPPQGTPVDVFPDDPPAGSGNGTPGGSLLSIFHIDVARRQQDGNRGPQ